MEWISIIISAIIAVSGWFIIDIPSKLVFALVEWPEIKTVTAAFLKNPKRII